MDDLNMVIIEGRLTRDPELKYLQSGTAVGSLSMASNRSYKGKDGQYTKETTFVEVELWGKTAEVCSEHLAKGRGVRVTGTLKQESWDDKDTGAKRTKMKVKADRVDFMPQPKQEGQPEQHEAPRQQQGRSRPAQPAPEGTDSDFEDDIPF